MGFGGAILSAVGAGTLVLYHVPNAALTAATATGTEHEEFNGDWGLAADSVCANPPPGLQLIKAQIQSDSEELKIVTATCPAGKNLLSTGAEVTGGSGEIVIDDVRPAAALTNVTVTGIEDDSGTVFDWNVTAYAICANP